MSVCMCGGVLVSVCVHVCPCVCVEGFLFQCVYMYVCVCVEGFKDNVTWMAKKAKCTTWMPMLSSALDLSGEF